MKIAIIGTHSTGKTTLIETLRIAFAESGVETAVVPEMARLCPFPINEESTVQAQSWILENQIAAEESIDHRGKVLVCDRASIDNWAYFCRALSRSGCVIHNNAWERKAVAHARTYDFIFKTHMLPLPPEKDGTRATDEAFRREMDALISSMLETHAVRHQVLAPTTDYTTHVGFIMQQILPTFLDPQPAVAVRDFRSIRSHSR